MELLPVRVVDKGEVHHANIHNPDSTDDQGHDCHASLTVDLRMFIAVSICIIVEEGNHFVETLRERLVALLGKWAISEQILRVMFWVQNVFLSGIVDHNREENGLNDRLDACKNPYKERKVPVNPGVEP